MTTVSRYQTGINVMRCRSILPARVWLSDLVDPLVSLWNVR